MFINLLICYSHIVLLYCTTQILGYELCIIRTLQNSYLMRLGIDLENFTYYFSAACMAMKNIIMVNAIAYHFTPVYSKQIKKKLMLH